MLSGGEIIDCHNTEKIGAFMIFLYAMQDFQTILPRIFYFHIIFHTATGTSIILIYF